MEGETAHLPRHEQSTHQCCLPQWSNIHEEEAAVGDQLSLPLCDSLDPSIPSPAAMRTRDDDHHQERKREAGPCAAPAREETSVPSNSSAPSEMGMRTPHPNTVRCVHGCAHRGGRNSVSPTPFLPGPPHACCFRHESSTPEVRVHVTLSNRADPPLHTWQTRGPNSLAF